MTKSIKEKTRLANIRRCKEANIPVPTELLKIKISYNNNSNRQCIFFKNIKQTLNNRDWVKEQFSKAFVNINEQMIHIARNLDIYDFKICVNFSYTFYAIEKEIQDNDYVEVCSTLQLYSKKCYIGKIALNNRVVHTRRTIPVELLVGQLITPECIEPLVSDYKDNWTQFPYIIRFNSYFNTDFSKKFPDSSFSKTLLSFKQLEKHYFEKLKVEGYLSVNYDISENIEVDIYDKSLQNAIANNFKMPKRVYISNPKIFDKITFIKMMIYLELINIPIEESDIKAKNIDEIESLIQLSIY
jgi:hypothetical protein